MKILLLAAAVLLPGNDTYMAPAMAESGFHYEYLPYEHCTLDHIDVPDVSLPLKRPKLCKQSMQQSDQACAKFGGTKMTNKGVLSCRIQIRQADKVKIPLTSTGPTFPGPAKTVKPIIGNGGAGGGPGPYDAGSGAELKAVGGGTIPKGCVLRPETCEKAK